MSIPEGDHYLPKSESMLDAFQVPARAHFTIGKSVEQIKKAPMQKVAYATEEFLDAGIAYLANRGHDKNLQEAGTVAWQAVRNNSVVGVYTDDMIEGAHYLGLPLDIARQEIKDENEPYFLFVKPEKGKIMVEAAFILMPPTFAARAQTNPIEALATTAWICSQIKDFANGRLTIDEEAFYARATGLEVHFLQEALRRHPGTILSENSREAIKKFPKGLDSVDQRLKYKSISILRSENPQWN